MAVLLKQVASGYCTDAFTQKILLGRLAHIPWIETILYWIVIAVILLGVVSYLCNIVRLCSHSLLTKVALTITGVCDSSGPHTAAQ